jgi:superfamily II DNA or RNA helicase
VDREPLVEVIPRASGLGVLTMRPYQVDAVNAIYQSWQRHQATLCVLPTGCGKTVVAAEVICRWPGEGRALFIAHLREILFQTQDAIDRHICERPGLEMGAHREGTQGHGILDRARVLCASIQTLTARMSKLDPKEFDLLIFDEAHHAGAVSYRKVWDWFSRGNPQIRGLLITATPNRTDNISLGCIATDAAYEMQIEDAINEGWLVAPLQVSVKIEGLDFSQCRTRRNKAGEQDFADEDIARVMGGVTLSDGMAEEERVALIQQAEKTCHAMAEPTIREAQGRQGIVFCASVSQAQRMAEVLTRWEGVTAQAVIGETDEEERKTIVQRFRNGLLQFLCLCQIGTEGFDVPGVEVVVMGRPTKSPSLYKQMLGRGLRPLPGVVDGYTLAEERRLAIAESAKPNMLVLDFVGVGKQHKLVSVLDVLAGDMPPDLLEEVRAEMVETGQPTDVRLAAWEKKRKRDEEAERKRKEYEERKRRQAEAEARQRERIKAAVQYSTAMIDAFDRADVGPTRQVEQFRGGCSDKQINMLVRLGMQREKAMRLTPRQASGAIGERLSRSGKDYIVRASGPCMGKSLGELARTDLPALKRLAATTTDAELVKNLDQYREQWRRGER